MNTYTPEEVILVVADARGWPQAETEDLIVAASGVDWGDPQELAELAELLSQDADLSQLPGAQKLAYLFQQASTMEDFQSVDTLFSGFVDGVLQDLNAGAMAARRAAGAAGRASASPLLWAGLGLGAVFLLTRR